MNKFELKLKLKNAHPVMSGNVVKEIIASAEFVNKDIQAMIDRSVSSVKNLFTVQTIDDYAEEMRTYTQDFLDKLDKLGINWLISLPTGLNFSCTPETPYIIVSEPFAVKTAWASSHIRQLIAEGKGKTFMMSGISGFALNTDHCHFRSKFDEDKESKCGYIIRGKLVENSILSKLYQE